MTTIHSSALTLFLLLPASSVASDFNDPGNILIADQFNNRVIEVDPATHKIVWQFGNGTGVAGMGTVVGPNDAERVGTYTLIAGTGTPPANPPLPGCPTPATGCPDNRVMLVTSAGMVMWQYGQAGVTGSGANQLNTPVQATYLPSFKGKAGFYVMITDQGNQRVIVVNGAKSILWQYGTTGVSGSGPNQLANPNSGELLANGNILISDENNNRALELTIGGTIVHQYSAMGTVSGVAFASRLSNGNTLLTDSNNSRAVEVDANDAVVWEYITNVQTGSTPSPFPTRAVRLKNGNTLISDQFNERVLEVNASKQIVFQQGVINAPGYGADQLNGPYDAKVIGDYTGLTHP